MTEAIRYRVYEDQKVKVEEIFVPSLSMTLDSNWEVRRTNTIDIKHRTFTPDQSELANPQYITFMQHEVKLIESDKKMTEESKTNITISTKLVKIMEELVKIYDEKVRLNFLQERVTKKIDSIYDIHEADFNVIIDNLSRQL